MSNPKRTPPHPAPSNRSPIRRKRKAVEKPRRATRPTKALAAGLPLSKQVDILIQHAKAQGRDTTYRGIAKVTIPPGGDKPLVVAMTVQRLHSGRRDNPQLKTLLILGEVLASVDLGYFSCRTEQECLDYIAGVARELELNQIAALSADLPADARQAVLRLIRSLKKRIDEI